MVNGIPRWRSPAVIGAVAAALVVAAVAAIALGSDDSEPRQLAIRAGTTTSSEPDTTTTSVAETTTTTSAIGTNEETTTTTRRRTAATTATTAARTTPTTARTALTSPPVGTMRSSDGQVAGEQGSYCWQGDGQSLCSDSADIDPAQTLRVRQGSSLELRWAIEEQPVSVQAKSTQGTQWVDVTPAPPNANPATFTPTFAPGTYRIAVFSQWSRGDVTHFYKVEVY